MNGATADRRGSPRTSSGSTGRASFGAAGLRPGGGVRRCQRLRQRWPGPHV